MIQGYCVPASCRFPCSVGIPASDMYRFRSRVAGPDLLGSSLSVSLHYMFPVTMSEFIPGKGFLMVDWLVGWLDSLLVPICLGHNVKLLRFRRCARIMGLSLSGVCHFLVCCRLFLAASTRYFCVLQYYTSRVYLYLLYFFCFWCETGQWIIVHCNSGWYTDDGDDPKLYFPWKGN